MFATRYDASSVGPLTFRVVNDRDLVPYLPPRALSASERLLVSGTPGRLRVLRETLERRALSERYAHAGQLRLLRPEGGVTAEVAEEQAREPAFLAEPQTPRVLVRDLPQLLLRFPELLKDHAPINSLTRDGYIERLGRL